MQSHPILFRPVRQDVLVLALILSFFFLRGLNVAAVQLPFNGWDEFAHMAVVVHVKKHGAMPTPDDTIAEELLPFVQAHAHPWLSYTQVKPWNATLYPGGVCGSDLQIPEGGDLIKLYQAQHGGLYYHLQAQLVGEFDPASMLKWADKARMLAICLGVGVLAMWWWILNSLIPGQTGRWLAHGSILLCAGYGYFMHNFTRVANDPLSIFLASLAFLGYVLCLKDSAPSQKRLIWAFVLGGGCGLAVLAKATALPLAVVLGVGCLVPVVRGRHPLRHGVAAAALLTLGYFLVAGWYHWKCIQEYGSLTMMQEAVFNAKNGKSTWDVLASLPAMPWDGMANFFFYYFQAYASGWSGFISPLWQNGVFKAVVLASGGCLILCISLNRLRPSLSALLSRLWELGVLLCMTWLALLYHSLHSFVAWGIPTTGAWYGMLTMPALFLFIMTGPRLLHQWAGNIAAAVLFIIFGVGLYVGAYYVLPLCQTGAVTVVNAINVLENHHMLLRPNLHYTIPAEILLFTLCVLWLGWSMAGPHGRDGDA